jgi:hypothetical protein
VQTLTLFGSLGADISAEFSALQVVKVKVKVSMSLNT